VNISHLLELGTAHSAARPHLRPALDKNKSALEAMAAEIIGRGVEAVARGAA